MTATHSAKRDYLEPAFEAADKSQVGATKVKSRLPEETRRLIHLVSTIPGDRTYGVTRRICTYAGKQGGPFAIFEDRTLVVQAPNAAAASRLADVAAASLAPSMPVHMDPRQVW